MLGGAGYVIQRRLASAPELAALFGPRLWSARLRALVTPAEPLIHRAVAKIATGDNPADNFWRAGNMIGAIDASSGRITRVVRGTGMDQRANESHPDTGCPMVGTMIPDWAAVTKSVREAATLFPGIRTQSWDVALSDRGPVLLEVNYGGDLNLAQLAHGKGVLDEVYAEHLRRCGYKLR
jgi:Sugar-transfer associated ATP-grasp